jgi:predicted lipoprotein with Yx(FWY)xxD motif
MVVHTLVRNAIAGSAALVLTLTACSSSKSGNAGGDNSTPAGGGGSSASTGGVMLTLANGTLVGPNGHTLYFNTVDTASAIKCTGGCAAEWPPLTKTITAGSGLDQKDFGTAKRDDGSTQVTYFGHPLYYFSGDSAAGDTKGNELKDEGGEWYATTPKEAADEKPGDDAGKGGGDSSSQPASSSSDGGYTY